MCSRARRTRQEVRPRHRAPASSRRGLKDTRRPLLIGFDDVSDWYGPRERLKRSNPRMFFKEGPTMIERADTDRSTTAIERSVSQAPRHVQEAIQRRRGQLGLQPLRLTWSVDQARAAIAKTRAAATRHQLARIRGALAVARMKAEARA